MWIVAEATKGCRQRLSWLKHNDNIGREIRERESEIDDADYSEAPGQVGGSKCRAQRRTGL